jgi:hypothetical protein
MDPGIRKAPYRGSRIRNTVLMRSPAMYRLFIDRNNNDKIFSLIRRSSVVVIERFDLEDKEENGVETHIFV